jgi:hypothetical protein
VSPQHLLSRLNGFLRAVILRVNEANGQPQSERDKPNRRNTF